MAINLNTVAAPTSGTISSPGLGSGINVNSLVTNLVNATIQPQQTLLQIQQAKDQTTISALGVVQSALIGLQTAVNPLTTGGALNGLTATSSDTATFTASASSSAVAGSYSVQVDALAQANSLSSAAYASSSTVVGDGGVTLTAGGHSFTVTLSAGKDTLQDLANAINTDPKNTGVSASIINSVDGAHLLLSAKQTGVANQVSVSTTLMAPFSTVQNASDAKVFIAGFEHDSSSNTTTDALSGVTLNLVNAKPNTTLNLKISADTSSAASAIDSFVTAYNQALGLLSTDTSYNTDSGQGGPLLGDPTVTGAMQRLQGLIGSTVPSTGANAFTTLSSIGIQVQADGSLSLDQNQLDAALNQNLASVQSLFSGPSGIGTQVNTLLEQVAGPSGSLSSESASYQTDYSNLATQLQGLQAQAAQLTQRYTSQFNSMNSVVSHYNSLSNMLTQTFASWNNVTTKSNGG